MAYTKHNFKSGDKLFAFQLNEMDEQITQNENDIETLKNRGTEFPFVFVDGIPADADTSKLYVIDGEVWAWMRKNVEVKHNANDGTCQEDARPKANSNIGIFDTDNGCLTTAPIQLDKSRSSNVVNLSGLEKLYTNFYAPCYVYYYTADGSLLGYTNPGHPTLGLGATLDGDTLPLPSTFDVSKRADYFGQATQIRIMFGITANAEISASDYENFVINCEWLDTTEDVWGWYSTGQRLFDDTTTKQNTADIADLQERMDDVEEALGSGTGGTVAAPLFAKLGLIGDSLTNQDYQGWQELAVSMLGNPEWHKNAVTGSSVANYGDNRSNDPLYTPFVDRYLDTPEDCDCIVIMGGTNDATYHSSYDMGTVGTLDTNTFKGAYSTIIEGLLTRNPATRIMLMTPPRSYTQADKALKTNIGEYAEATKEIAQYYGLPCLDFYDTLGWNKVTAEWCSFNFAGGDTVHFSYDIGPRVGRMVANFIRNNY
jgi:lysophospholipase L1-like esterase